MRRALPALFLLSFPLLPLAAQSADVSVKITANRGLYPAPPPGEAVPVGWQVIYQVEFSWEAEVVPRNVILEVDVPGNVSEIWDGRFDAPYRCSLEPAARPIRCVMNEDFTSFTGEMQVVTTLPFPGLNTATATIRSDTPDPDLSNNTASSTLEVRPGPALVPTITARERVEPGGPSYFEAVVTNVGQPADGITVTLTLPDGGTFGNVYPTWVNASCVVEPQRVVCTRPTLTSEERMVRLHVEYRGAERFDGGPMRVELTASANHPDVQPSDDSITAQLPLIRYLFVTNTEDEGAGSLRQALLESHTHCVLQPCTIAFQIPATAAQAGVFTIRPRTPLPQVRGFVKIDGATQKAFGGDSNPEGPEIELHGSELGPGANGLLLGEGCEIQVLDLAVTGFPAPGIEAHRGIAHPQDCIRTIIPNTLIARNHLRQNFRGAAIARSGYTSLDANLIRDNVRAGIFVEGSTYVSITHNRILDNGASGVFLDTGYGGFSFSGMVGADVTENVIAGNAEWGIARTPVGMIAVRDNSIFGNRHLGIDVGLDLETPNRPNDEEAVPNKPVLFSATYDATTGKTVIRGRLDTAPAYWPWRMIDVYASSSGIAQGERLVGSLQNPQGEFTAEADGDLRGKFITATYTRGRYAGFLRDPGTNSHQQDFPTNTSEFSNTIVAQ